MENKLQLISKMVIRSKTNNGDLSKHICFLTTADNVSATLIIYKYVLININENSIYKEYKVLKTFKNKKLCRIKFSINMNILGNIVQWINQLSGNFNN